jgi:uncharacterized membrane protein
MSDLTVISFADPAKAFDLRARLVELQTEYLISMDDIVVATRSEKGKVHLHQAANLTAAGAASGSFWGLLIGMVFFNPLFGLAAGAGAGALSGYLTDIGISNDMMKQMGKTLEPGGAAVFVLVRKATGDKVLDRLADFTGSGTVLQTSLTADSEEKLRAVFDKASV